MDEAISPDEAAARAEAIREAVRADPSLILQDPDALRALVDADEARGGRKVVDLRSVLVGRLEERLGRLEETHRSVIAAAYENLAGANQIHRAVLAVLEPATMSDLLRVLAHDVPNMLAVDQMRVCIESPTADSPDAGLGEAVVAMQPGAIDAYLDLGAPASHRRVTLRESFPEADIVYGAAARYIRSEALIRLDLGPGRDGLLVFGAEDVNRFSPDQGGDLLTFFGGVIERVIRRFLD